MKISILTPSLFVLAFLSLAFIPSDTTIIADTYTVIKVDGQIKYVKNGNDMTRGDKFASNEKLDFKSQQSRAAVISKSKGRFVLTPKKVSSNKANLLPAMSNISMRSGEILNLLDLQKHFSDDLALLDEIKVKIKVSDFPMDNDNFFYLTYQHNGDEIAKKLESKDDHVVISRAEIFKIDGQPIPVPGKIQATLYHRNASSKTSKKINSFNLASPVYEDLKAEFDILRSAQPAPVNEEKMGKVLHAYMTEFYGKIDTEDLAEWCAQNNLK